MESLMEKVLYKGAVEFKSRTYGADASLTEMLWNEPKVDPRIMNEPKLITPEPAITVSEKPLILDIENPFKTSGITAYAELGSDDRYNIGITHHDNGSGKLKVYDKEEEKEYGIPICDIVRPLKDWRIDER